MSPHLGLQRIMIPSAQVSSLTTGSITLPSAKTAFNDFNLQARVYMPSNQSTITTAMQVFNVGTESLTVFENKLATTNGVGGGGLANNTIAGYFQESFSNGADFTKVNFSTQVASFLTGGLRDGACGVSNDGTAGYHGGGVAGGGYLNSMSKLNFSTDAYSNIGSTIYASIIQGYAWSTGASFGYFGAGFNTSNSTTGSVSKYNYSNETASGTNSVVSLRLGTAASSASKGYLFGGYNNSNSNVNTVQSWTYSSDTQSTLGATLSAARRENHSGGSYAFLYVLGGTEVSAITTIQKFTTSTEAMSTSGTSLTYTAGTGQNAAVNNRGA